MPLLMPRRILSSDTCRVEKTRPLTTAILCCSSKLISSPCVLRCKTAYIGCCDKNAVMSLLRSWTQSCRFHLRHEKRTVVSAPRVSQREPSACVAAKVAVMPSPAMAMPPGDLQATMNCCCGSVLSPMSGMCARRRNYIRPCEGCCDALNVNVSNADVKA